MDVRKIVFGTPYSAQKKGELYRLVRFLRDKNDIKTIVEIGVMHGGTSAIFKQCFPEAEVVGVDIAPEAVGRLELAEEHGFEVVVGDSFQEATRNRVMAGLSRKEIDFLFIDGSHLYESVKKDYEVWSPVARIVALHDIADAPQNGGVPAFWKELKNKKQPRLIKEFIESEDDGRATWAGIGVIDEDIFS